MWLFCIKDRLLIFNIDFLDPLTCTVLKQTKTINLKIFSLTKVSIRDNDYLYLGGSKDSNLYMAKYYAFDLDKYDNFEKQDVSWMPVTPTYQLVNFTVSLIADSFSDSLTIDTNPNVILVNHNSPTSMDLVKHVALWIDDFNMTYSSDTHVSIDQIWA